MKYSIYNHQIGETVMFETQQTLPLDHLAAAFQLGPGYENSGREIREHVYTLYYRYGSITMYLHPKA